MTEDDVKQVARTLVTDPEFQELIATAVTDALPSEGTISEAIRKGVNDAMPFSESIANAIYGAKGAPTAKAFKQSAKTAKKK